LRVISSSSRSTSCSCSACDLARPDPEARALTSALVTGCAGFIGSHLVETLLAAQYRVVGIDCFTDSYDPNEKRRNLEAAIDWDDFEFHDVDLVNADLRALLDGCDLVFHLAAESGVRTSWGPRFPAFVRNNVVATQRLLEASNDGQLARFVYASSSSVYGQSERLPTHESAPARPLSPYGVTKLAGEHLCELYRESYGVPTVALRYFSVYGPRQRPDMAFRQFCQAAITGRPLTVFGNGRQTRDFTYVTDAVAATAQAARVPAAIGGVYNISGGAEVSLESAIRVLEQIVERRLVVERSELQLGEASASAADTSRARIELGYEPLVSFEDGLRLQFEWMRSRAPPARGEPPSPGGT
jgi:UDP-glucuronate 4-epimerase